MITACGNDFEIVGTAALFLTDVEDQINCTDRAGAATGLPDLSAGITGVPEACSPVSFPIFPPQLVCSTKDQHPQVYIGNQGGEKFLLKRHQHDLHGAMIVAHDTPAAQLTSAGADRRGQWCRDQGGPERHEMRLITQKRVHRDHQPDEDRRFELHVQRR